MSSIRSQDPASRLLLGIRRDLILVMRAGLDFAGHAGSACIRRAV
jgi:hypothetical protein